MRVKRWVQDIAFAVFMIGAGVFVIRKTRSFPRISSEAMGSGLGPAFYPNLVAIILIGLSLIIIGRAVLNIRKKDSESQKSSGKVAARGDYSHYRVPAVIFVLLVAYAAVIELLGFKLSTFLFVATSVAVLSSADLRSNWKSFGAILGTAAVVTFIVYGVFSYVAKVPLPVQTILMR